MNPFDILVNQVMLPILNAFYGITHSYGLAIILLTLTVKAALFPLTAKQFKASRQMQQLQPKLQELQKQYKNNPEEMQRRLMEFYKENNANPFSSCLPTLIQLPFIFALYAALMSEGFRRAIEHTGFLFIRDLANAGIFTGPGAPHWDNLILVILFGVSTFVMQKMMTTNPNDPMQRQMLVMMPVMITGMFLFFPLPSGVLLYIVVSNLITLGQNAVLMKQMPVPVMPMTPASQAIIETKAEPAPEKESRASKRQRLREAARKKEK